MLLYLELLEANDVGLRPCEPSREIVQAIVDVVDVESSYLQCPGLIAQLLNLRAYLISKLEGLITIRNREAS
jgi:hypothetical protein